MQKWIKMHVHITKTHVNTTQYEALGHKWKILEADSDCSFFLSWAWIEAWLEHMTENVIVIEAKYNKKTVGLSLWVESSRKVLGLFTIKQANLHRTNDVNKDQVWIEYNDFLLDKAVADDVRNAMINFIKQECLEWQEINIGLSLPHVIQSFEHYFSNSYKVISSLGYRVKYENNTSKSTLVTYSNYRQNILSKNTRQQVNRSEKLLKELGTLKFATVSKPEDVSHYLSRISELHISKWGHTAEGSGFENPYFVNFIRQLILDSTVPMVEVAILFLDEKPIGYLLNFIYENRVNFYLSAIETGFNPKIKIGMLLHTMSIEYYETKGLDFYDLLAGDARYKQSLSNNKYKMCLMRFINGCNLIVWENRIRNWKNKLKRQ